MGAFARRFMTLLPRAGKTRAEQAGAMGLGVSALFNLIRGDEVPADEQLGKIFDGLKLTEPEREEMWRLIALDRADGATKVYLKKIYTQPPEKKAAPPPGPEKGVPVFELNIAQGSSGADSEFFLGPSDKVLVVPGLDDPSAIGCIFGGDSMEPRLNDGDILVFSPAQAPQSGDICFVVSDRLSTIRKTIFEGEELRLVAYNQGYPEHRIQRKDAEQLWRLIGVFTWFKAREPGDTAS